MLDFTLQKYQVLCQSLLDSGYRPITLSFYLFERPFEEGICILRHDVDRKLNNALMMAELEYRMGIRSTYYFRFPHTFNPEIIRNIASLGHEIGYHYETLAKTNGDHEKAIQLFKQELEEFRKIADIKTICMHGSPLSKYDNRDLWKYEDFRDFGIIGEAYLSIKNACYFSDTGRSWNSKINVRDNFNGQIQNLPINSTDELVGFIKINSINLIYLTIHPERWSFNSSDWIMQYTKDMMFNMGKRIFLLRHKNVQGP